MRVPLIFEVHDIQMCSKILRIDVGTLALLGDLSGELNLPRVSKDFFIVVLFIIADLPGSIPKKKLFAGLVRLIACQMATCKISKMLHHQSDNIF